MRLPSIAGLFLVALPARGGMISFSVPEIINAGDAITVMVNMNSEQGYVYDYTLRLSATEKSLPSGYLGGRAFAMEDLRGKYLHQLFLLALRLRKSYITETCC